MPCLTIHCQKKVIISLLSTLTSLYLIAALSFHQSPSRNLPRPHRRQNHRNSWGTCGLWVVPAWVCGLCCGQRRTHQSSHLLANAGLWVVPWVCDLSLYSNWSAICLWFMMWVCALWWLYGLWTGIASIFFSTLSLWVCVLCFVVFYDVGLVNRRHFDGSGLIWYFSGGWVFDSVGFYMDFMSTTAGELAGKAERRWGMSERERERERKGENIFLTREEREI